MSYLPGPGRRRAQKRRQPVLTEHVPIRFPPDLFDDVKVLADEDNKTVSSWVRDIIRAEVRRRKHGA